MDGIKKAKPPEGLDQVRHEERRARLWQVHEKGIPGSYTADDLELQYQLMLANRAALHVRVEVISVAEDLETKD